MWGNPGKSDPYLRVKLGDKTVDFRDKAVNDALDVDLCQVA